VAVSLLGGLSDAAFAGGGGGCHSRQSDSASITIDMKDNCFFSTVARISIGETVTWVNRDVSPHMISGLDWGASNSNILQGQAASVKFEKSGVFPYFCPLHPGMVGAVVVGDGSPSELETKAGGFVSSNQTFQPAPAPDAPSTAGVASRGVETDWSVVALGAGLSSVAVVGAGAAAYRAGRRA
jgi:plastocyanin